jgi:hypothetical protein
MDSALSLAGQFVSGTRKRAAPALWPALLIVALVTALRLADTIEPDVAWQLWIAGRIHAGAHLYRDIIEVNPPLWFWMALPIDSLARLLGTRADALLIIGMGVLAALSISATERLVARIPERRRMLLLGYSALCLTALPWVHVGQREQIALIGTLPYAALIAARAEQRTVRWAFALAVGALAALGFALKHYFLIVPVLLELWLLVFHRRAWKLVRPEVVAIVCVGAAYAAAVMLCAPEFLTDIVPLARLTYGMTGAPHWLDLFHPFALLGLATLAFATVQRFRLKNEAPLASALLVCAAAFAAAYFIQSKGWFYQSTPFVAYASLALASLLAETALPAPLLRKVSPALLALPLVFAAEERFYALSPGDDLRSAISGLHQGESVGFVATDNAIAWSVTLQRKLRYPSRFMSFWMLNAIVRNEELGNPDPRLDALGRQVVSETVNDFRCTPPARIIVSRPRPGEDAYDILPFFLRDASFRELLSHYRERSRTTLDSYERTTPLLPPARPCRSGV